MHIHNLSAIIVSLAVAYALPANEIHDAILAKDIEKAKAAIAANPKLVNEKDQRGDTPLFLAIIHGQAPVMKALLEKGADINFKFEKTGETYLFYVTTKETAELLMDKGLKVTDTDKMGSTPLQRAAFRNHLDVVKVLLAKAANVNAKDNSGYTPLHEAASANHRAVVEQLLEKGANVNAKDNDGKTPLDFAQEQNEQEIAKLLKQKGGKSGK